MLAQTAPVSQRGETGSAQQHHGMMRLLGALQHLLRGEGGPFCGTWGAARLDVGEFSSAGPGGIQ